MCHQPWSGLPLQDTADLWSHWLGEAALERDRTQLLLSCQGLAHSCAWQSAWDSKFGERSASRFKEGRYEGNLCFLLPTGCFGDPSLSTNERVAAALKSIERTESQSRCAGKGHISRALLGTISGLTSPTNVLIQVEISNANIDAVSALAVHSPA